MLNPQAQLGQNIIWQVAWRLGYEVHPHTFGANQPNHLLQAILQRLGRAIEKQMRLVEKQSQQGLVGIAALRKLLEQLSQQP
ncbi:hypothetical protein D3C77_522320 [compost metagenome]